ncbi:MAG: hypothetical protein HYX21_01685 [Candidatus Yanofskybacteria bacterium]|nr:hypothetical protein [Candidatus Yanofskybacteria bacterium]
MKETYTYISEEQINIVSESSRLELSSNGVDKRKEGISVPSFPSLLRGEDLVSPLVGFRLLELTTASRPDSPKGSSGQAPAFKSS